MNIKFTGPGNAPLSLQGWSASHSGNESATWAPIHLDGKVVALTVATGDYDECITDVIATGKMLELACNAYDQLAARIDWLQRMHTLHRSVEMLYVVDGYQVTVCWDGDPISTGYHGETLAAAIDKAMAEFNAWAKPKWVSRQGDPSDLAEQLATAIELNGKLVNALKLVQKHVGDEIDHRIVDRTPGAPTLDVIVDEAIKAACAP